MHTENSRRSFAYFGYYYPNPTGLVLHPVKVA